MKIENFKLYERETGLIYFGTAKIEYNTIAMRYTKTMNHLDVKHSETYVADRLFKSGDYIICESTSRKELCNNNGEVFQVNVNMYPLISDIEIIDHGTETINSGKLYIDSKCNLYFMFNENNQSWDTPFFESNLKNYQLAKDSPYIETCNLNLVYVELNREPYMFYLLGRKIKMSDVLIKKLMDEYIDSEYFDYPMSKSIRSVIERYI